MWKYKILALTLEYKISILSYIQIQINKLFFKKC